MEIICAQSQAPLSGKVFALCLGESKARPIPLSPEVVKAIPLGSRSSLKRNEYTGGVNVCRSGIAGMDEYRRLTLDPTTDFDFSLTEQDFQRYLPIAYEAFSLSAAA